MPPCLVVEDGPEIRRFLGSTLGAEGFRVVESPNARRGAIDAGTHRPDLAIVDLALPDFDGRELIRRIREWSPMPIVVLSARHQEQIKIEALDAGADDYVTKPFGVGELLARVRAALRHAARSPAGQVLELGPARVDLGERHAWRDGAEIHLTPIEFRLLGCLAKHLGTVQPREFEQLLAREHALGRGAEALQQVEFAIGKLDAAALGRGEAAATQVELPAGEAVSAPLGAARRQQLAGDLVAAQDGAD